MILLHPEVSAHIWMSINSHSDRQSAPKHKSLIRLDVGPDLLPVLHSVPDDVAGDGLADGDPLLEDVGLRDSGSVNDNSGSVEIYTLA